MEIGSSDQMTLAAVANQSQQPLVCFLGALTALALVSILTIFLSRYLRLIPISMNTISGVILLATGAVMLWKS